MQKCSKNNSYFFTTNRVEKFAVGPDCFEKETNTAPIRFSDYPWRPENSILIYEICRLSRLIKLDSVFIRLEQVKKRNI